MSHPTPPDAVEALLTARASAPESLSTRGVAAALELPESSARTLLVRYSPVKESLAQIQREPFVALNQLVALESGDRARQALAEGKAKDSRDFMLTSAIAQDKALLMAGQPTAITAVTHELRSRLPDLLARATRVLEARRQALGSGGPAQGSETGSDQGSGPEAEDR